MSIISYRNKLLNSISDIDFPDSIKILSAIQSPDNSSHTRITVDRSLNWDVNDSVIIIDTTDYNGNKRLYYVNNSNNQFDIDVQFTNSQTGELKYTSHKYKDSIYEIKNFPAVLLGIDKTKFVTDNKTSTIEAKFEYFYFVIDKLENFGSKDDSKTLELAQDYVEGKALSFLKEAPSSVKIEIDELESFEHFIGANEIVGSMGKLFIIDN